MGRRQDNSRSMSVTVKCVNCDEYFQADLKDHNVTRGDYGGGWTYNYAKGKRYIVSDQLDATTYNEEYECPHCHKKMKIDASVKMRGILREEDY